MDTRWTRAAACGCVASLAGLAAGAGMATDADLGRPGSAAGFQPINIDAAMAGARVVGVGDQIELIVPLPLTDEARRVGAVGQEKTYKGLCGPDGAPATPEQLFQHARRDLERMNNPQRGGDITEFIGESPRFAITYSALDPFTVVFVMPSFREAAEYIDRQLDDRVEIRVDLSSDDIDGNTIGTAGSASFRVRYADYRVGLRAASDRFPESRDFADGLPSGSLPVRYDGSTTSTAETEIVTNASQARAIFGDNMIGQGTAVSITIDNTAEWDFFAFEDDQVESGKLSLVDVAVHELTHGLGFRSQLREAGINPNNRVAGLDVSRFRFSATGGALFGAVGGPPITAAQFTTFPRLGENLIFTDANYYTTPVGASVDQIELEGGDTSSGGGLLQPSHLAHRASFADKLGLMDPIINTGTTFGPAYWGDNETRPLDDMGWKIIRAIDVIGDCNGNGIPDIIDIAGGFRDADGDNRLDVCEEFLDDVSPAGAFVSRSTQTVLDAGGATSLFFFSPSNATVLDRFTVTSLDQDFTSADADTVRVFSGFIFAPEPDEYAFRVQHGDDVLLTIAGEQVFLTGEGELDASLSGSNLSDNPSLPVFLQLEAGWHSFEMTVLVRQAGPLRIVRESRSLGGWGPVPQDNLGGTFFNDCNGNNRDDLLEPDSDGDGIIDACEEPDCDGDNIPDNQELDCDANGVPDDCEPRGDLNAAFDIGVAGTDTDLLEFGTCNSPAGFQFDTEIAIWNADGDLIASNDDADGCNLGLLSRLDLTLPAGEYIIGTTGFNALFSDDFGIDFPGDTCRAGGAYLLRVGNAGTVIADVEPGKIRYVRFEIEATSCPADLAAPFGTLNFFDVTAFLGRFNAGDLGADFAAPFGSLNFFDVTAYLAAFNAGCP